MCMMIMEFGFANCVPKVEVKSFLDTREEKNVPNVVPFGNYDYFCTFEKIHPLTLKRKVRKNEKQNSNLV